MKKKQDEKAKQKNPVEAQESPAEKKKPEAEQPQEKSDEQPAQGEKQEKPPQLEDEATDDAQDEESGEDDAESSDLEQEAPEAEETSAEDEQTEPVANGGDENEKLRADLLTANSKLAAYAAGVRQDMIDDAVTLATAQAQAAGGEVTEKAVTAAMTEVLKRHPDWKAEAPSKKKAGGFKLGADPDAATGRKSGKTEKTEKKRWNRFQ